MGKSTRKKQEKLAARERSFTERLAAHRDQNTKSRGPVTANEIMTPTIRRYSGYYLRNRAAWKYLGKSRKAEKQRLELIRYLFGKYSVPRFLEQALVSEDKEFTQFASWYVTAAQGGSLYKTCTRNVLSKKETHLFLQAPDDLTIKEAIWWAKAMALCDNVGVAYRMARCSIVRRGDYANAFWIDVHRFFTNNPVSLKEMDELIDYVTAERRDNGNWSIKKRSLESIRRKSEEWHRAQYKMRHIGGGSWEGMKVPDWKFVTGKHDPNPQKSTRVEWFVRQILSGNELAREGQKMRHCVASYKRTCMSGHAAIFSMTSNTPNQTDRRNLTIEVNAHSRQIVQARGFTNRIPRPQERLILNRWARESQLTFPRWY